jgi:hypothetical protein
MYLGLCLYYAKSSVLVFLDMSPWNRFFRHNNGGLHVHGEVDDHIKQGKENKGENQESEDDGGCHPEFDVCVNDRTGSNDNSLTEVKHSCYEENR